MPTYVVTAAAGRLKQPHKAAIAETITRIHNEVTGAPSFFAQVIFHQVAPEDWFVGGAPLDRETLFVHGHIRAGRSAVDRRRLLTRLAAELCGAAAMAPYAVWVYIAELPSRAMVEFGHVLPEPGDEAAWTEALPEDDRRRMQAIGRRSQA
jgi:phenylpyruvate tautomerase PptA (4-oxalocrotonate tautomerase family)